ncbi:MAG: SCO family protein [Proteobacteria bacterium]|nr:SCO family protein [Pseudomonadota bacterium]MDA1058108.1 SCO family protein [Pseudomonadota bacterium]
MPDSDTTTPAAKRRWPILITAAVLAVAVGLGLGFLIPVTKPELAVSQSIVGGPFEMVNHRGETVTQETFKGRFMLVYFGYTFCPDVCPTELQAITVALNDMGTRADDITPVFVTIDPARDDVAAVRDYVAFFHPRLVGLTGSPAQVKAMTDAFGVYYAQARDTGASSDYLMDHSSLIFLMDRQGRYVTHIRTGTAPEAIARQLEAAL